MPAPGAAGSLALIFAGLLATPEARRQPVESCDLSDGAEQKNQDADEDRLHLLKAVLNASLLEQGSENVSGKCEPASYGKTPESFTKYDSVEKYIAEKRQAVSQNGWWAQMASVANRANNMASPVAGWERVMYHDMGSEPDVGCAYNQFALIYQKPQCAHGDVEEKPDCVLTFSSMQYKSDVGTNFDTATVEWCGWKQVHRGYASRVDDFMKSSAWEKFSGHLQNKCGKVIGAGHSQGGGLLSLLAACANRKPQVKIVPFTFDSLYTFGVPGLTLGERLFDGTDGNCFKGARFYNKDGHMSDPIAAISHKYDFVHPFVRSIRLIEDGGEVTIERSECDTHDSKWRPTWHWYRVFGFSMHLCKAYVKRLLTLADHDEEAKSGGWGC